MSERAAQAVQARRPEAIHRSLPGVVVAASLLASASAQQQAPDPAAQQAFRDLVKATRARKPFEVKSTLVIEAIEGEVRRESPTIESTQRFDPSASPRRAALALNGFDVLLDGGRITVRHASNDREYVQFEDDGDPYYALLTTFTDLPFPQIGLVLGEAEPDEVLPQLCSRAAWIVPTKVETIEANAEKNQPALRRLHLTSEFERMTLDIDPARHAISAMNLTISGGPMVRPGASLEFRLRCTDTDLPAEEAAKAFAFDPGDRRRVDAIVALPRGSEGGGGGASAPTMVGRPAPPLELPRFDDGDFDLANFRGRKVVIVDFWATWCGPCRVSLPQLDAVARTLQERGAPVAVAAINTLEGLKGEELRRKVGAFWKEKNFSMILALDEDGHAAEQFGVRGIPATFVIGLDGTVVWEHVGMSEEYGKSLLEAVEKAIAPAADAGKP